MSHIRNRSYPTLWTVPANATAVHHLERLNPAVHGPGTTGTGRGDLTGPHPLPNGETIINDAGKYKVKGGHGLSAFQHKWGHEISKNHFGMETKN